jgi:FAD/FMN-containing dehydrogenase
MKLNDVHSRLNPTLVWRLERPSSLEELCALVQLARAEAKPIAVAGGRHAMGGQQFLTGGLQIDSTELSRVLSVDCARGLIEVEAGIMWPALITAANAMPHPSGGTWAIRQKQTGVDAVSIGGSVSVAAHGRGLLMAPLGDDVESLVLINAQGHPVRCSRTENSALFSLTVGGYGLFGLIYSVQLRLMKRLKLVRVVDVIDLDDAVSAIYRRVAEGCLYGDFQYAIDPTDARFLRKGVFACYRPAESTAPAPETHADLPEQAWLQLLALAHSDKTRAFKLYATHYLQTDGHLYWSDTMQLSTYIPSYSDYLAKHGAVVAAAMHESLVIGEHYVPTDQLLAFMDMARTILREHACEVIYGTLRAIQTDTTSYLAWASQPFVCVIFNLRTAHTAAGIARTTGCFRALTDASSQLGGSFFLTYHRFASAAQVERAYPKIRTFFALKRQYDPDELFQSDWYLHYKDAFADRTNCGESRDA